MDSWMTYNALLEVQIDLFIRKKNAESIEIRHTHFQNIIES